MHVETLSPDLVRTVDAIELPPVGAEVLARAERTDSYPIWVTRSPEETVERLLQTIGEAYVAVITDETVADLHGPLILGALRRPVSGPRWPPSRPASGTRRSGRR